MNHKELESHLSEIIEMKFTGMSYKKIGNVFGVHWQSIRILFKVSSEVRSILASKSNCECQVCGLHVGLSGNVHHLMNRDYEVNDLRNLMYLCLPCHIQLHHNGIPPEKYNAYKGVKLKYRGGPFNNPVVSIESQQEMC